ncbi:MAG: hypothetical protein BWX66_02077 [Deltaproteobacteria bacterium ADurb.Bin058]|nr:MAG: hypothetical protein BWX66_02077 [Deltaproteobacteria bacterium ADurb.Bin058]
MQKVRTALPDIWPLKMYDSVAKRCAWILAAATVLARISLEDSPVGKSWDNSEKVTDGTSTCKSILSISGPETFDLYLLISAGEQVQRCLESPR